MVQGRLGELNSLSTFLPNRNDGGRQMTRAINRTFILLIGVGVAFVGCVDRKSPVFREFTRIEEERADTAVERAIGESNSIRELYEVCKQTPIFANLAPRNRGIISKNPDKILLTLGYLITNPDHQSIITTIKEQMSTRGWSLEGEQVGIWETELDFTNTVFSVQIVYNKYADSNFLINCERLARQ